ncbi:MAG: recombinase family protein [Chloroflexi bacterium]|nr:recombinase family protein [Chloroflexota bacterium]
MIAATYSRVSTTQQEEGTSLASQELRCRQEAEKDGYTVPERLMWRDQASGADLHRDALNEVRRAAKEGEFNALYVYAIDRLSREPLELGTLLKEFEEIGVHVHFVVDHIGDGTEAPLIAYVLGHAAKQERLRFRERSMRGKETVAREGKRLPHGDGKGVLGYRYDPITKKRTVIPEEAKIVKRIFHEVAEGHTLNGIRNSLMDDGIPTKQGNKVWHVTTLRQILSHTMYIGVDTYGKNRVITSNKTTEDKTKRGEPKKRIFPQPESDWIWITGYTEPIITREEWDAAQAQLARHQSVRREGQKVNFLTGIVTCGACGHAVRSAHLKYYRCQKTHTGRHIERTCYESNIPKSALENLVWEKFCDMLLQPDALLNAVRSTMETAHRDLPAEIDEARRALEKTERQYGQLLDLKGAVPETVFDDRLKRLNDQHHHQQVELETLGRLQENQVDVASEEAGILKRCQEVAARIDAADDEEKGKALRLFGASVVATRERVEIQLAVDFHSNSVTVLSPSTG